MEDDTDELVFQESLDYIKAHSKWKLTRWDHFRYVWRSVLYLIALFFAIVTNLYYLLLFIVPFYLRFIIGYYQDVKFKSLVTPLSKEENYKLLVDYLQQKEKISFKQFSEYIVAYPVLPFYRIKTEIVILPLDKKILIGCTLSSKYVGYSGDHRSIRNLKKEIAARL